MTVQLSFSAQKQEIRSRFREMMTRAESTEDVKKFFYQTVRPLLMELSILSMVVIVALL